MASIKIDNLSINYPVFETSSRSIKKELLSALVGGTILKSDSGRVSVNALNEISLDIKNGDRIGIVGHNGSGKTTLLRAIAGIIYPSAGSVSVDGRVGCLLDPMAGMDFESTGLENIFLRGYVLGMTRKEIDKSIDDIAEFTELGEYLRLPVKTYSAGMVSRLAFAISTSTHPDILLVDEGIGSGDANFIQKIVDRTHSFFSRAEILLIASHNSQLIDDVTDKVLRLEHGRIVEPVE